MNTPRKITADVHFRHPSRLGEGPLWDGGTLYWVDILQKELWAKPDRSAHAERFDVGLEIGSFVLWNHGRALLATERGFQCYDLATRHLTPWHNPEPGIAGNRFNDGKCDPTGRFVAGTMERDGAFEQGTLYVLDHDRSVRAIHPRVSISNGLAWSAEGTTLYFVDTHLRTVQAFTYDLATGTLSGGRTVIEVPARHGGPDGMCIDREGNLWIGLWDGWGVECWNPGTGRQVARIEIPAARVTSCTFGGPDFDTLFITTARCGLSESVLAKQPLAGSVFWARPGVSGSAAIRYRSSVEA